MTSSEKQEAAQNALRLSNIMNAMVYDYIETFMFLTNVVGIPKAYFKEAQRHCDVTANKLYTAALDFYKQQRYSESAGFIKQSIEHMVKALQELNAGAATANYF